MNFNPNSIVLFVLVAVIICVVIAQSVHFMSKAKKRAKEIGLSDEKVKSTIMTSIVFSIAPAISILIGVISLSKFLGFALPWLRLSVIGSITYEFAAATTAAAALSVSTTETITNPQVFSTIVWVMTLGIIPSLILVPVFGEKIQNGLVKIKSKDEKWGEIFQSALFLGMISAFLGLVFADVSSGLVGFIPVFVMLVSAIVMSVCGIIIKKFKVKWVEDFALPISMLVAMFLAIPITNLVTSIIGG